MATTTFNMHVGTKNMEDKPANQMFCYAQHVNGISSLPKTIGTSSLYEITSDSVVLYYVLSNPAAQAGDWTITTNSNGSWTISGNIVSGQTTDLFIVFGKK